MVKISEFNHFIPLKNRISELNHLWSISELFTPEAVKCGVKVHEKARISESCFMYQIAYM